MISRLFLVVLLALPGAAFAQGSQRIDAAKSSIRFVSKQMNVPVEGRFRKFDASVAFDPAKPEATRAEFEVDLGSIDLGNAEGETEAKRKLWLDVEAFPKAKFVASSVKQVASGKYEASGALTIKGTSRNIVAPFTLADAPGVRTVEGQFPLKRLQYRVGEAQWSDTDTVADEVIVRFRFVIPR
jgi:polyisoprenoid-binding protein YceI